MSEGLQYSKNELKTGQLPHQLFLFNMVGNHILLSIIALSNSTVPWIAGGVPIISILIIAFTLLMGQKYKDDVSDFVKCHWRVVLKRTRIFMIAYVLVLTAAGLAWALNSMIPIKEMAYAIVGGLGILPTMVMVLVLTVMESETLHHALNGHVPDSLREKYLGAAPVPVSEPE
jgi:hypothetical protein